MIRPECYKPWGEGYAPPTPDEVKELLKRHRVSSAKAAALIGVSDGRTVRRWKAPADSPGARQIDYPSWRLLLYILEPAAITKTAP